MERGILLISLGGSTYTGWAVNMAVSLRFHSPNIPICLVADDKTRSSLREYEYKLFDQVIEAKPEHYHSDTGSFAPGRMKLNMYGYSPFEQTIYLDIDGIVVKDITPLFEQLKGNPVKSQVNSISTEVNETWPCQWMSLKDTRFVYSLGETFELPEINSSFMYFERCKEAETFFDMAKKCYINDYKTTWGNSFPDELAFNVAACKTKTNLRYSEVEDNPVVFLVKTNDLNKFDKGTYVIGLYGERQHQFHRAYMLYQNLNSKYNARVLGKTPTYRIDFLMKKKFVSGGRNLIGREFEIPKVPIFEADKYKERVLVGITTAKRAENLLIDTLKGLEGYKTTVFAEPDADVSIFEGSSIDIVTNKKQLGGFGNFKNMVNSMLKTDSDYYLLCEDDFTPNKGFHQAINEVITADKKGVYSLFQFPNPFHSFAENGWGEFRHENNYAGTVCLLIDRETLQTISKSKTFTDWIKIHGYNQQRDLCLGTVCKENNIPIYIHQPSLVTHTGYGKSTLDKSHFENGKAPVE